MGNRKFMVVVAICVLALILIWTPLQFDTGNSRIILGGYYWIMPDELKGFFLAVSLGFSAVFSILPLIYYILLKKISSLTETLEEEATTTKESKQVAESTEIMEKEEEEEEETDILEEF